MFQFFKGLKKIHFLEFFNILVFILILIQTGKIDIDCPGETAVPRHIGHQIEGPLKPLDTIAL